MGSTQPVTAMSTGDISWA